MIWYKCCAAIIAGMVLFGMTSAQDYEIRLTFNTNLRESNSLEANVLETALAGTTLQVAGEFNRWLRIIRNRRELWMASWVKHTRVTASPQTGYQEQSPQVDNCCFVDRQCQSDAEWEAGYRAYENNQCPAPSQTQPQPSAQLPTQRTVQVDNCCYVDRQCQSDADWTNGYWAFQNGQCPTLAQPAASTQPVDRWGPSERTIGRPIIEGSEWFVYGINSTLDLMQRSAAEWYNFVLNAADKIVESFNEATPDYPHANTTNWARGASRTIGVGAGSLSCYLGRLCRVGVASILAHEACHIYQHWDGVAYTEPPCQKDARDAIAAIYAS